MTNPKASTGSSLIIDDELVLYGVVGDHWRDHFTARMVLEALAEMQGDITVRINSGGGIVFDGVSIYNSLKAHNGKVTVIVDAVAASAASIIAMAGDNIVMSEGASLMIHNASNITWGNKEDHDETRDLLAMIDLQMAKIYRDRTGLDLSVIENMMTEETWMTSEDAIAQGFADGDGSESETKAKAIAPAAFAYDLYKNAPAICQAVSMTRDAFNASPNSLSNPALAAIVAPPTQEDKFMPKPVTPDATQQATATAPVAAATLDENAIQAAAVQSERKRAGDIRAAVKAAKLPDVTADSLIESGASIEDARASILDALAEQNNNGVEIHNHIEVTADGGDRFREGATRGLMMRGGMEDGERNEFTGYTLRELARASLEQRGVSHRSMNAVAMIGLAFNPQAAGYHSTSDFAHILKDVAHKSMLKGYEEAEETYHLWTAKGVLTDFKATHRIDLNLFPNLQDLGESGEYKYATIGDRGETIKLATYGSMFAINRQTVINDDMNMLTKVPARMGRAAKRTIGNLVYTELTSNPNMSDGTALFHADHNNLGTPGAPGIDTVKEGLVKMGTQKDPDGIAAGLNIRPKFMLTPIELEIDAEDLMVAEYDPTKTQKKRNPVRGKAQVIADARLDSVSKTAWYMLADPSQYDTIEVAYLDGVETPFMDQQDGWSVDGAEFKVRIDAGVKALDHRAMFKNAGV